MKCFDTGDTLLSFGLFSESICLDILDLNAWPVTPASHFCHFLHTIKFTKLINKVISSAFFQLALIAVDIGSSATKHALRSCAHIISAV